MKGALPRSYGVKHAWRGGGGEAGVTETLLFIIYYSVTQTIVTVETEK